MLDYCWIFPILFIYNSRCIFACLHIYQGGTWFPSFPTNIYHKRTCSMNHRGLQIPLVFMKTREVFALTAWPIYFLQGCWFNWQTRVSKIKSRICSHWFFNLKTIMHFWEAWYDSTQFKLKKFSLQKCMVVFIFACIARWEMYHDIFVMNLIGRKGFIVYICIYTFLWYLSGDKVWSVICLPLPSHHGLTWPWVQREMPAPEAAPIQSQPSAEFKSEFDQTAVCYTSPVACFHSSAILLFIDHGHFFPVRHSFQLPRLGCIMNFLSCSHFRIPCRSVFVKAVVPYGRSSCP